MAYHIKTVTVPITDKNSNFDKDVAEATKGKQIVDIKYAMYSDSEGLYAQSAMIIYKSTQ